MPEGNCRILALDENSASSCLLGWHLARAGGADVTFAEDAVAALALLRSRAYDLLLVHAVAQGLEGFDLFERIRDYAVANGVAVIVMVSNSRVGGHVRSVSSGAVDYLSKPFSAEQFRACVGAHVSLLRARRAFRERSGRLQEEIDAHLRSKAIIDCLLHEVDSDGRECDIVGEAPTFKRALAQVEIAARTASPLLIRGEPGTGKEILAREIHRRSARCGRPFVKISCVGVPRELIDSELFGLTHTIRNGGTQQLRGRLGFGEGGTLFLDDVSELPLQTQANLLVVLREQALDGDSHGLMRDVRLIAATSRTLTQLTAAGLFRGDLLHRLSVCPVDVPPLRERHEDIPRLIAHFAARAARRLGKRIPEIGPSFLQWAMAYRWPGNVRELENVVERAVILSGASTLHSDPLAAQAEKLEDVSRAYIRQVLEQTCWVIEGERGAARVLGLKPGTVRARLRKLGLSQPPGQSTASA
ncbi:MAG: sigma-54-dependent transcriptional regulator [Burkholderiales bacterium]